MDDNQSTFWEKVAKKVSGNASEKDKIGMPPQSPEFNEAKRQAQQIWNNTALPTPDYEPDVERGWQRLQLRVQTRQLPPVTASKKENFIFRWAVAATISVVLVALAYFLIKPASPEWTEIRTAAHQTKTIRLADGSTVALNQNSTFSYPTNFQKENRTVRLSGEAFFNVAKAEGKRFTIFAEGTKTEVIGTAFNLRAYSQEPVKVQVVEGKVAFARTATDDAIFLVPGQEGFIAEKGVTAHKQVIQNTNFESWKTKSLTFNNTQLDQLVTDLENYFNVSITIQNESLRYCRFTTSFQNPDLKEVLDILAVTGNLTITQKGTSYYLDGPGCK
ncbi:FecR domain-containing protein [Adhaeribacter swui]|uniref:FecR domain-containing protein n=1 Tax=Adhaeribacter swui TaxID=2086471 RepID=A0A7G7GDC2_9BACT|nr:FecR domain-containing protein [Adhaeribacter swui]QNF35156.1 FecR domain-containing protein [Adhaeribacter swui]